MWEVVGEGVRRTEKKGQEFRNRSPPEIFSNTAGSHFQKAWPQTLVHRPCTRRSVMSK